MNIRPVWGKTRVKHHRSPYSIANKKGKDENFGYPTGEHKDLNSAQCHPIPTHLERWLIIQTEDALSKAARARTYLSEGKRPHEKEESSPSPDHGYEGEILVDVLRGNIT